MLILLEDLLWLFFMNLLLLYLTRVNNTNFPNIINYKSKLYTSEDHMNFVQT